MRRALAAAAIAVVAAAAGSAAQAAPAVLEGAVANGTAGAGVPEGLPVTLVVVDADGKEAARRSATVAAGRFSAGEVEVPGGGRVLAVAEHLGVTYSTVSPEGGLPGALDLRIFETTEDPAALAVRSETMTVVSGTGNEFEVLVLVTVENRSDRTFVGTAAQGGREVLRLPLPEGAFDVSPAEGLAGKLVPVDRGMATTEPLLPGEASISYLYRMAAPRTGWFVTRPFFYPTARLDLLTGPGLTLNSAGMRFEETVRLAGREYRRYRGGPFRAGAVMEGVVASPQEPSGNYWRGLGGGLAVLALAGAVPYVLRRRRRASAPPSGLFPGGRAAIIEEIARLDESFDSGSITPERHAAARARLKARLAAAGSAAGAQAPPKVAAGAPSAGEDAATPQHRGGEPQA